MTDPAQLERWMVERRLQCEIDGHFTARLVHERVWDEKGADCSWMSDPDFCLVCEEQVTS